MSTIVAAAAAAAASTRTAVSPCSSSARRDFQDLVYMSEELIVMVFSYLTPAAIVKTRELSKAWAVVSTMDRIWKPLCVTRWQLFQPRLLRLTRYGVHSYTGLYRHLDGAKQKPNGAYSNQDKLTWGHARHDGVEAWLTLGHRSDCRTIRVHSKSYIQLRVVVQNLSAPVVWVDMAAIQVHFKNGPIVPVIGVDSRLHPQIDMTPRVLAWNGQATSESATCLSSPSLRFLDFVVLGVYVECNECDFEADFLERASSVWVPMKRRGDCTDLSRCRCMLIPDHYHHFGLHVSVVDESVIWNRYTECNRGFMVLNAKDRLRETNSHDLPMRYLIDDRA
ncbi:unnamed protein product [Aphanomyces euteiches]|uniref:F-box domain-containing protein n=1 Tax=Aphanomyces euteiches TaxID=100861 RepID=A0A6G0W5X9_9STRA|nr:hypothetical protein Ae201684_018863 [Aphanomyces euteiches]KAH9144620.1 hypothetical protein AeRB84_011423 [Aphanomyces euteiches]